MKSIFATQTPALDNWRDAPDLVAAEQETQALAEAREQAKREYEDAWRSATGHAEGVQVTPSPASPVWPLLTVYQQRDQRWKDADRRYQQALQRAQESASRSGYAVCQQCIADTVVPALERLRAVILGYEALQATVQERTGARLTHLGRVDLDSKALNEYIERMTRASAGG